MGVELSQRLFTKIKKLNFIPIKWSSSKKVTSYKVEIQRGGEILALKVVNKCFKKRTKKGMTNFITKR